MTIGYYEERVPDWLRRLGCFEFGRDGARFRWGGEFSRGWGLGFEICLFGDNPYYSLHFRPIYGNCFIRLCAAKREPHEMMESWGFSWNWRDTAIHLNWGSRSKVVWMPWLWKHHLTEVLRSDGTWRPQKRVALGGEPYDSASAPLPDVHVERHPYHYMLQSGETQHVTATITVERSTWRRVKWLPWPRKVRRYIEVWFSHEVGERAGSWKGGCLGCSYEMRRGETPRETLRRMQRERRFR